MTQRHIFIWSRKWWVIQVSILIFLKLLENVFDEYSYGNSKQLFIVNSMFIRQIWYLNHHMALPLPDHVFGQMSGHLITCVGVESLFISRIDIQWRIKVQSNSISLNSQKPRSPYSNMISQIPNKMSKTRLIALIGAQYSKIQVDIIRWKMYASWRPMTKWTLCSSRQRRHENGVGSDDVVCVRDFSYVEHRTRRMELFVLLPLKIGSFQHSCFTRKVKLQKRVWNNF